MFDKPTQIEIQNALRTLTKAAKHDDDFRFVGGDVLMLNGHAMRTQEAAEMLAQGQSY